MAFYDAFREQGERLTEEQRRRSRLRGPDMGGGAGTNFSWFNNPSGIRDFAGDKRKQETQDAEFLAKYGMTAADMVEAYRLGKVKEGATPGGPSTLFTGSQGLGTFGMDQEQGLPFDVGRKYRDGQPILTTPAETISKTGEQKALESKYKGLREDISAMREAQKAALLARQTTAEAYSAKQGGGASKGTDEFARLEKAKKLLMEQEGKATPGPQQEAVRKQLSDVNNRMAEYLQIPMQPYQAPKRPEWSWADLLPGGKSPQADYDKRYGTPSGNKSTPAPKVREQAGGEGKDITGKPIIFNPTSKRWEYK